MLSLSTFPTNGYAFPTSTILYLQRHDCGLVDWAFGGFWLDNYLKWTLGQGGEADFVPHYHLRSCLSDQCHLVVMQMWWESYHSRKFCWIINGQLAGSYLEFSNNSKGNETEACISISPKQSKTANFMNGACCLYYRIV